MPQIVPIRDLKDTNGIYEKVKSATEPVFVTRNGYGAMVIMSMEAYERDFALIEIRRKLQEAEESISSGAKMISSDVAFDLLREKIKNEQL
ncbi:MAG: type II toxin-antitoxin system Phd/YefM family antitoxin [Clostridiaceae bacterium]|jgi:PHD/YefM family antitoxin component YafN of YafNO toxin-antitoxin module|nr:type II toxin-antitoxin system Phd/YefM family antitoxin [Clostridiaceae bacterium]